MVPSAGQDLETVVCECCQSSRSRLLYTGKDLYGRVPDEFRVVECEDCRLVYLNPRPSRSYVYRDRSADENYEIPAKDLRRFKRRVNRFKHPFRRWVLAAAKNYPYPDVKRALVLKHLAEFLSAFTTRWVIPYQGEGRLLDVGCSNGLSLAILKELGWKTWGCDVEPLPCQAARSLGLDVFCGTLEAAQYPDAFFDVVRLNQVLEHVPHPLATLCEIARVLKPGGVLYVAVPNQDSLVSVLFKEIWFGMPTHLYAYTAQTLAELCRRAGLWVNRVCYTYSKGTAETCLRWWASQRKGVVSRVILTCCGAKWFRDGLIWPLSVILSWLGRSEILQMKASRELGKERCNEKEISNSQIQSTTGQSKPADGYCSLFSSRLP